MLHGRKRRKEGGRRVRKGGKGRGNCVAVKQERKGKKGVCGINSTNSFNYNVSTFTPRDSE